MKQRQGAGTWDDVAGRTLVTVNSPLDRPEELSAVLDRLADRGAEVCVIAPAPWRAALEARNWPAERVLFTVDSAGREIELNYFLEQLDALHWILAKQFDLVICSAPHSLYNDEIKDTLERRVALFLGAGRLVTHALPEPHVYFLDLADLVRRLDRDRRTREYVDATRAMMADLFEEWQSKGRPAREDTAAPAGGALAKHFGPILEFDESSMPASAGLVSADAVGEFLRYLEDIFHPAIGLRDRHVQDLDATVERQRLAIEARDRMLAELHEEMGREVTRRDALNGEIAEERRAAVAGRDAIIVDIAEERRVAVSERDAIIDRLRQELTRLTAGWRRAINGRPRV